MINWFFKYRIPGLGEKAPTPAKAAPAPPAVTAKAAGAKSKSKPQPQPPPRPAKDTEADWAPRLQAAMGDDAALLEVLGAAPVLAVKLAAVQALAGEAALKQAERAARHHDRRVHRLAKQRLEAAVAQRQSRTSAQALLARAEALVGTAEVAVNELVELDRDWQSLDASLLEPAQVDAFTTWRERLSTQVRERGELLQALKRWSADAARTRESLRTALALAADEGNIDGLPAQQSAAQALVESRPDVDTTRADGVALQALLDAALAVQARLAWLAEAEAAQPAEGASTEAPPVPGGWDALPRLADDALASALARRFDVWQRAWAGRHAPPPAPPKPPKPARAARPALPGSEQQAELDALLQQAEAALADGQTGALQQRLQAIDQWLDDAGPLRLAESSQARWTALQTEGTRLKGWQAWGGALARDALVDEAEALARLAAAAMPAPAGDGRRSQPAMAAPSKAAVEPPVEVPMEGQPAAMADGPMDAPTDAAIDDPAARTEEDAGTIRVDAVAPAEAPAPRPPRLKLKAHADAIHSLRQRWKQLDRQGAAAKQATWARFDTALQAAYLPVAAQHAAQQATRERNLHTREALLVELESITLPDEGEGASAWKDRVRALDRFQLAWRPLGPLEHTVPAAARVPLQQRLRAAVERIEQPLAAAREAAAARRERLIADAQALLGDGSRPPGPQAPGRVRELQAAWQDEARALPLTRPVETALWGRFKAATDAVFVLRDAGFAARDAEAAAALAGREALIERLSTLPADAAPADAERLLAEVDRAWRQPADLPRGAAAGLDARYADARSAVRRQAAERGRRRWHDECDALVARLGLCDERDDRAAADGETATLADDLAARWAAAGEVPPSWRDALAQRWAGRPAAGPLPASDVEVHLLQLEAVFDMPASAEQQAARRELKLRALKDTLEGRARADDGPAAHRSWLLALLRQGGINAGQRERLRRLLAALRGSDAGSLAGPPSRS